MPPTIQELFLQFQPLEPLEAGDPRYVECFEERGVGALFSQLSLPLGSQKPNPLFFAGHLGDGKTTILKLLAARLGTEGLFVAYGEADERLDLDDVAHEEVLLAILAVVDDALRTRYRQAIEAGYFRQVVDELTRIAQLPVALEASAQVSLGPVAAITATVRDAPDVRLQVRQDLRQARGPTFLDVVNEYLDRAQALVAERGHRRLVVILDNFDRLPEPLVAGEAPADERLFLGQATALLALRCHVIYAVRLALAHSQAANIQARYGQFPLVVPMIPIRHPDGLPHEGGLARLREVMERRAGAAGAALDEAFDPEAISRLCGACGGHLRDLMTLIQRASAEALARQGRLPITAVHAEAAIADFSALRQAAAGLHREAVATVAQTHRLDALPAETQQALLAGRLVYEYYFDGRYWYDPSPLLRPRHP